VENKNIGWEEALLQFYNSKVYSILEKEEIKHWYEGQIIYIWDW
jgi:hypothetical protein